MYRYEPLPQLDQNPTRITLELDSDKLRFYTKYDLDEIVNEEDNQAVPSINTILSYTSNNDYSGARNWVSQKLVNYEHAELLTDFETSLWALRGDVIHESLEYYIHNGVLRLDKYISETLNEWLNKIDEIEKHQDIPENLTRFGVYKLLDNFFGVFYEAVRDLDVVWCLSERKLWGSRFAGTIDAAYYTPDTDNKFITVLDLKTTSKFRNYSVSKHSDKLMEYIIQMHSYGLLVQELYGIPVSHVHLLSVCPTCVENIIVPFDTVVCNNKHLNTNYLSLLVDRITEFYDRYHILSF